MQKLVCWCCEHFEQLSRSVIKDNRIINGVCMLKIRFCHMQDDVCNNFNLRKDMRQNKTISDLCNK